MDRKTAVEIMAPFQERAPVDVQGIAAKLGIAVFEDQLPEGVSGVLRESAHSPSGYEIIVRRDHPMNRKRFTVAHELAHFVLHRDADIHELIEDEFYRGLSIRLEREANEFAADILMPWPLINKLSGEDRRNFPELAAALGVSRQTLATRLGLPYDQSWE